MIVVLFHQDGEFRNAVPSGRSKMARDLIENNINIAGRRVFVTRASLVSQK